MMLEGARAAVRAVQHVGTGLFDAFAELGNARMAPPRTPREAAHRLAGALGAIGRAHAIAVRREGEIPRGVALVVANHTSYLDPFAVLPLCPAIPLAKFEVASWPVIGPIGTALGVQFVARRDRMGRVRALRRIHDVLASGATVLNFPEGTTTRGDRVAPFWRGSFGVAQRLGVPVVPVAIRYVDPEIAWYGGAAFVPHYVRMASRARIAVTVTFAPAMLPRAREAPEAMAERARRTIAQLLGKDLDAGIGDDVHPARPHPILPPPVDDHTGKRRRRGTWSAA